MKSKQCTKCKQYKLLTEFRNDKKSTDGKQSQCKECRKATDKAYASRQDVKERIHEIMCGRCVIRVIRTRVTTWYSVTYQAGV